MYFIPLPMRCMISISLLPLRISVTAEREVLHSSSEEEWVKREEKDSNFCHDA